MKYNAGLLVMRQPDIIDAHLLHQDHFAAHFLFRHPSAHPRMVFMPMRPPDEQSLSVEQERAMIDKRIISKAKFRRLCTNLTVFTGNADVQMIQGRMFGRPGLRSANDK